MNKCCKQIEDNARRQLEIVFDEKEAVLKRNSELIQELAKARHLLAVASEYVKERPLPNARDRLVSHEIGLFLENDDD